MQTMQTMQYPSMSVGPQYQQYPDMTSGYPQYPGVGGMVMGGMVLPERIQ